VLYVVIESFIARRRNAPAALGLPEPAE